MAGLTKIPKPGDLDNDMLTAANRSQSSNHQAGYFKTPDDKHFFRWAGERICIISLADEDLPSMVVVPYVVGMLYSYGAVPCSHKEVEKARSRAYLFIRNF